MVVFLNIIIIISITQLCLVFLLVLVIFFHKLFVIRSKKLNYKLAVRTQKLIEEYLVTGSQINPKDFKILSSNLISLLKIVKHFDSSHQTDPCWLKIKKNLLHTLLLPKARVYSTNRSWYKRYFATQVFQLKFQKKDSTIIQLLIQDSVPLIALNAAKIAISSSSKSMIKTLIRSFSSNRLLQNSLFLQAVRVTKPALSLIALHLNQEKDIYARVFCYQLLNGYPDVRPDVEQILNDINSTNIDLEIAALTCYAARRPENIHSLFAEKIRDTRWQIRAKIANLIGKIEDSTMSFLLENALKDANWWVRMNAAESLYKLGPEGIDILKSLRPEDDQFAYDTASRVLASEQIKGKP